MKALFMALNPEVTIDGATFGRLDETAPDGRWIVDCDRCSGSGHGRLRSEGVYDPCPECDGHGVTLQDPIDPIVPCKTEDHEFVLEYNSSDGLMIRCVDEHSFLVKRAMLEWSRREHGGHIYTIPECEFIEGTDYLDFRLRVKLKYVTCDNPGGWHGLDTRCDCGYSIDIAEVVENEGGNGV